MPLLWKDLIPDSLRGTTPNPPPTFVDVYLQDLLLADDLAAAAGFTAVLVADAAALALAALAHAGHLLDHTHPQLVEAHLHACPVARHAHLHRPFTAPPAWTEGREEDNGEAPECFHCLTETSSD